MYMITSIREAEIASIPSLLRLMRAYYEFDNHQFDEAGARSGLLELLANETYGKIWLIVVDERSVGYIALTFGFVLEFHGRDAFIDELFIDEEYRHRGLGKQAMDHALDYARSLGVKAVHLEVERENIVARELYRKMGFKERERFFLMSAKL